MIGGVGDGVSVLVTVGGIGDSDGVCVRLGSGVRETCGVAVARGVSVTSGANVLVGMTSAAGCGVQAASSASAPSAAAHDHFRIPAFVRTIRGMTLIFLLLIALVPVLKLGDSTISLNSNRPILLRLAGDGEFAVATYDSDGGEQVTLTAESALPSVVLDVIDPTGDTIAYAEADSTGVVTLPRLTLENAGRYIVRANTFNGEGTGEVTVTLTRHAPPVMTPDGTTLRVPLGAGEVAAITLEDFEGATVTITVRDPGGLLDPLVTVTDVQSVGLASNDDHGSADVSLNRFDARLTVALGAQPTVFISEFLGRPGWFEVSIRP